MKLFLFITIFIFLSPFAKAECLLSWPQGGHRLYLGPEGYHLRREKEGGSSQKGWLYGGYGSYERRPRGGIYWAFDGYYASGSLKGSTASGKTLKSVMTEHKVDGKLGVSLFFKNIKKMTFIPYGGYGALSSQNDFKKPSPLVCKYTDTINYAIAGFEISFFPFNSFDCGLNFESDFMLEGKSKIDKDPDYGVCDLIMKNKMQYEVDLLFRYSSFFKEKAFTAFMIPFYQSRHYGGQVNWPFDFMDTKFQIYGLRFLINFHF